MYNLKTVTYEATGEQDVTTYRIPIRTGHKREKPPPNEGGPISLEEAMERAERSLSVSLSRTKNTVYDYARANEWQWFLTWTTDPTKVDRHDYKAVTDKLSKWLNNVRSRKAPDLKYIIVPERHKDGAYHFHGLLSNTGTLKFTEAINPHTGKNIIIKGMQIYNLKEWSLGQTTATQIRDTLKASNYITKYITKELIHHTKDQKRYWNSKNLDVGLVDKDYVEEIDYVHTFVGDIAKRHKKMIVAGHDYHNEINIYTI